MLKAVKIQDQTSREWAEPLGRGWQETGQFFFLLPKLPDSSPSKSLWHITTGGEWSESVVDFPRE